MISNALPTTSFGLSKDLLLGFDSTPALRLSLSLKLFAIDDDDDRVAELSSSL